MHTYREKNYKEHILTQINMEYFFWFSLWIFKESLEVWFQWSRTDFHDPFVFKQWNQISDEILKFILLHFLFNKPFVLDNVSCPHKLCVYCQFVAKTIVVAQKINFPHKQIIGHMIGIFCNCPGIPFYWMTFLLYLHLMILKHAKRAIVYVSHSKV